MRKPTIAELRAKEVERLAGFKNPEPTKADIDEARKLMNSFYRLCGLDWRLSELVNDSKTANTRWVKDDEARAYQWYQRLDARFNELYGLRVTYCGVMPSIGTIEPGTGAFDEKISRYFYD